MEAEGAENYARKLLLRWIWLDYHAIDKLYVIHMLALLDWQGCRYKKVRFFAEKSYIQFKYLTAVIL